MDAIWNNIQSCTGDVYKSSTGIIKGENNYEERNYRFNG